MNIKKFFEKHYASIPLSLAGFETLSALGFSWFTEKDSEFNLFITIAVPVLAYIAGIGIEHLREPLKKKETHDL